MKKLLFVAIFTLLSGINLSQAQYNIENLKLTYGEEITDEKGTIVKIIGESNDKIYAVGLKGKGYFLKIFTSKEMKLVSNKPIELPEVKDKEIEFEEIFMLNGPPILGSFNNGGISLSSITPTIQISTLSMHIDPDGRTLVINVGNKLNAGDVLNIQYANAWT